MAQVSKRLRRLRRSKREASIALKMVDFALLQRDQARAMANLFAQEIQRLTADPTSGPPPTVEGEVVSPHGTVENVGYSNPIEVHDVQDNPTD